MTAKRKSSKSAVHVWRWVRYTERTIDAIAVFEFDLIAVQVTRRTHVVCAQACVFSNRTAVHALPVNKL